MEGSIAELAGAKVIFMTSNGPKNNFGHVEKNRITALAIGEYLGAPGDIFVFACDRHWQVVGALLYSSIEDAKGETWKHGVWPVYLYCRQVEHGS